MRILVIDDDRSLGRSLQIHLEGEGHETVTAATGGEGLAAAVAAGGALAALLWRRSRRRSRSAVEA